MNGNPQRGCNAGLLRVFANPVGGGWCVVVIAVIWMRNGKKLSDATCTAAAVANFWQDVSRDLRDWADLHTAESVGDALD